MKAIVALSFIALFGSCAQLSKDGSKLQEFQKRLPEAQIFDLKNSLREYNQENDLRL